MDEINQIPPLGSLLSDQKAMDLAITLAKKGHGFVSPNPPVGCVILDNQNKLLSFGYHEFYGGPHAEVNAVNRLAPDRLRDARVFVTLEPCAHFGKTPPCANMLAKLPIKEVIIGLRDPNPLVSGKGAKLLNDSGIKVTDSQGLTSKLERVCESFLMNMRESRPFISLKVAASLDGMSALSNGESQWITGTEARLEGHKLRAHHDATLVGVNTFIKDNPSLDIRHPEYEGKVNNVVVLDPHGRGLLHLKSSKLFLCHPRENIYWVVNDKIDLFPSILPPENILRVPTLASTKNLCLKNALQKIWMCGLKSLYVEGGPMTLSEFLNQRLADRLYLFLAPSLLGGKNGVPWSHFLGPIDHLSDRVELQPPEVTVHGKDLLLTARFL